MKVVIIIDLYFNGNIYRIARVDIFINTTIHLLYGKKHNFIDEFRNLSLWPITGTTKKSLKHNIILLKIKM